MDHVWCGCMPVTVPSRFPTCRVKAFNLETVGTCYVPASRNWTLCVPQSSPTLFLRSTDFSWAIFKVEFYDVWQQKTQTHKYNQIFCVQRTAQLTALRPHACAEQKLFSIAACVNYGMFFFTANYTVKTVLINLILSYFEENVHHLFRGV